jgi:uncharacterized protein YjbI with pentapeptide repeats
MAERLKRARTAGRNIPVRIRWPILAVLGLVLLLWLVLVAPKLLVPPRSDASLRDVSDAAKRHELEDARLKMQGDARAALLQGLGGLAVLLGALFAWKQLQHNIGASNREHELDHQGQITERFTRAVDQLGSERLDVRLGGIYALERIARDSRDYPADRRTIAEILTAYVRGHAPWPPSQPGPYLADTPLDQLPELQIRAPDVEAILTVLSRNALVSGQTPPPTPAALVIEVDPKASTDNKRVGLDLHATDLRKLNLGGQDAHLEEVLLSDAHLERANLAGAHLDCARLTRTDLEQATLSGAFLDGANLDGANLDEANLDGAHLKQARLSDTHLKRANLDGVCLDGAVLMGAHLEGADLGCTHLEGANLGGAYLAGAELGGAHLERAFLHTAHLKGAIANDQTVWPRGFDWQAAGVHSAGEEPAEADTPTHRDLEAAPDPPPVPGSPDPRS